MSTQNQSSSFALRLGAARIFFREGMPGRVGSLDRATRYSREAAAAKAAELGKFGAPWTAELVPEGQVRA